MVSGKKGKQWKGLKQIIQAQEQNEGTNYGSIEAPPSFKPAKKFSDISGLEANYTDPHSKLNYTNIAEFKVIKKLPVNTLNSYIYMILVKTNGNINF